MNREKTGRAMFAGFYDQPATYERMQSAIRWLGGEYGQLKIFPIGKSVLGREITALCIGNPAGSTLYVGATHGLEWLTGMLLIRFCENIMHAMATGGCVSDINIRKALQKRSVTILPCLNPDGVEIALKGPEAAGEKAGFIRGICGEQNCGEIWQANANGVDINHNFDAGWQELHRMEIDKGIESPSPTRYGGPHPNSEPETNAATTFCLTYQPRSLYAIHSQGEEIFWEYGRNTPVRSKMIAQILASSSGYAMARPNGLASHGGLKDWYIDKFCRPGFTLEVGLGKNPLPLEHLDKIYRRTEEMLILAALL